jgi:hypothetical protein
MYEIYEVLSLLFHVATMFSSSEDDEAITAISSDA